MQAGRPEETQQPRAAAGGTRSERLLVTLRYWAGYPYRLGPRVGTTGGVPAQPGRAAPDGGLLKLALSPFSRLALVQSLSSGGDAMVAVALANSVFFNVSEKAAQSDVALSLALTVAPFAVVGPLLGPMVERVRGGRRGLVMASALGRATCCFFMAFWVHSLVLFPIAFFTLVFSKLYLVTKAALVPGTVDRPDHLVLANSKLSVGGSVAGMVAGGAGVGVLEVLGASGLLRFDILVYLGCAVAAARLTAAPRSPLPPLLPPTLPPPPVALPTLATAARPADREAPPEPRRPGLPPGGLQLAAVATAALRCSVGFVTFLLVFTFRHHAAALIWYGLALGASQVGNIAGALVAPRLRLRAPEEWMLTGASVVVGTGALLAGVVHWGTHWGVAVLLAGGIGLAAGSGKLAFDSMVQRDVPSRVRGRSFARFESGFQLAWAIGSLLAVLIPMSLSEGFVAIGALGLIGAAAFAGGSRSARRGTLPTWFPGSAPRPPRSPPGAPGARR